MIIWLGGSYPGKDHDILRIFFEGKVFLSPLHHNQGGNVFCEYLGLTIGRSTVVDQLH